MTEALHADKVFIVTGGALGMGRTCARRFAEEGARVCVADIDLAGAEETVSAIRKAGGEAFACRVDVAEEADNDRMVEETIARYGGVDAALLNAAILGENTGFFESSVANFDRVIAVNQRSCYLGLKSVGRIIRPEGSVVVMSSAAGLTGWERNAAYSTSKHAIIGLVRSAAPAFAARNARVNIICPRAVATRMNHGPEIEEQQIIPAADLKIPPFRKHASTQHAAELVLFLTSSRAAYISGSVQVLDGGAGAAFGA